MDVSFGLYYFSCVVLEQKQVQPLQQHVRGKIFSRVVRVTSRWKYKDNWTSRGTGRSSNLNLWDEGNMGTTAQNIT